MRAVPAPRPTGPYRPSLRPISFESFFARTVAAPIGLSNLTRPIELYDQISGAALEPEPGIVRHDPPLSALTRNEPLIGYIAVIDPKLVEVRLRRLATVRAGSSTRPQGHTSSEGKTKHSREAGTSGHGRLTRSTRVRALEVVKSGRIWRTACTARSDWDR